MKFWNTTCTYEIIIPVSTN